MARFSFLLVGAAALVAGFWRGATFESTHRCEMKMGEKIEIISAVLDVKRSATNQKITVETGKEWPSTAYVYTDSFPLINPGELVKVKGKIVAVSWNPESARAAGICFEIRKAGIEKLGPAPGFFSLLRRTGVYISTLVNRVIPSPFGEVSAAMLLGRGEDLPSELSDNARIAGLSHALVLSGFNISMAVAFASVVASFLPRTLRILIAVATGMSLAGISGFGASAIRAAIGSSTAGFATWRFRKADPVTVLLIAILIMSWLNPLSLAYSLSLQLSALATLGVVSFSERFTMLPIIRYIPETFGLREAAAGTLAAEILVSPLIAWKIGLVPVLGLPANVFAGPAIPFAMLAALISALLGLINFSTPVLSTLLAVPARWFSGVSSYVSEFSFASVSISLTSAQAGVLLFTTIGFSLAAIYFDRRRQREIDAPLIERLQIAIRETEKRLPY